jgi:hypothetical protein
MAKERLTERQCATCGALDTEPHHVAYVAFTHPGTGEGVDLTVTKHVTCCAADGCPVCSADARAAQAAGVPLDRTFLTNRPAALRQELFERHRVETPDFAVPGTAEG